MKRVLDLVEFEMEKGVRACNSPTVTFTEKPLGFRVNAPILKKMGELDCEFAKVSFTKDGNTMVLLPVKQEIKSEDGKKTKTVRVTGVNKEKSSSGQSCSSEIGSWAKGKDLTDKNCEAEWDDDYGFIVDLTTAQPIAKRERKSGDDAEQEENNEETDEQEK